MAEQLSCLSLKERSLSLGSTPEDLTYNFETTTSYSNETITTPKSNSTSNYEDSFIDHEISEEILSTVTAEDLDISLLQPSPNSTDNVGKNSEDNICSTGGLHSRQVKKNMPKQTFYFYQANNGAHTYLHAINVQMLVHEYGSLDKCPLKISGKVVEKVSLNFF